MIGSLRGTVRSLAVDHCLVEVNGVGYVVQASARTLSALVADAPVFLHIETQVREDAITLFGFAAVPERDWFRHLVGVQGVGGRLALAILSVLSPDELARAIGAEDKAMIARANGVGARLATRIVTELKAKGVLVPGNAVGAAAPPAGGSARDAASALEHLGFRTAEAAQAVAAAATELGEGAAVADLVRVALRRAAR